MNKLRMLFALTVFLIITVSCEKSNNNNEKSIRDKFLVDKIYDRDDNLLAEYIYDANNRLIKGMVKSPLNEMDELVLEYENGRVSKITRYYGHCQDSFFDCKPSETHFFYNSQGQLIRRESRIKGFEPLGEDYLYENGRVASISMEESYYLVDTLFYDESMNVTKRIRVLSDLIFVDTIGNPILGGGGDLMTTYYFKYDDRPKPNFGLDYLFAYGLLPISDAGYLERNLSKNNITESILESGGYTERSTCTYTYNENGLPSTIEVKHERTDIKSEFLRITYRQIE